MKTAYRVALVSGCFASSLLLGSLGNYSYLEATTEDLKRNTIAIEEAIATRQPPRLSFTRRFIPGSPLFLLLSVASGVAGAGLAAQGLKIIPSWDSLFKNQPNPSQQHYNSVSISQSNPISVSITGQPVSVDQPASADLSIMPKPSSNPATSNSNEPSVWTIDKTKQGKNIEAVQHLMIEGSTGCGKSTFARILPHVLPGSWLIIDPHRKPEDWTNLPCVGGGRNYQEIATALQAVYDLMQYRYQLRDKGLEVGAIVNVVIDEFPAIAASEECQELAPKVMMQLSREARKVGIRIIILAQGAEVKALGIEGQGSVRENFLRIRCGDKAKEFALYYRQDPSLHERIKDLPFCYLAENKVLNVPDLATVTTDYKVLPLPPELQKLIPTKVAHNVRDRLEGLLDLPVGKEDSDLPTTSKPASLLEDKGLPGLPATEEITDLPHNPDPTENLPDWFLVLDERKQSTYYHQLKTLRSNGVSDTTIIEEHWRKGGKYYQGAKQVIAFLDLYYAEK